jgi:hypothetical protein
MTYPSDLKAALLDHLGRDWLVFMPNWTKSYHGQWASGKPKAILVHHSAAAATTSVNPKAPGNQKGANANVINYIQNHPLGCPAANFSLDRDGTVYVHAGLQIYHAGVGTFRGKKPWNSLGIPDNQGNSYMLGVEVIDKGLSQSWTEAQKDSLVHLMRACRDASGWSNIGLLRRPRHKDWTDRKPLDPRYTNEEIGEMILKYGFEQ